MTQVDERCLGFCVAEIGNFKHDRNNIAINMFLVIVQFKVSKNYIDRLLKPDL